MLAWFNLNKPKNDTYPFCRASWRAPFFLFAGFSALCVIGGCLVIDRDVPTEEKDKRVDWLGGILVTTGLVLLTFVLAQGELAPQGWKTPCTQFSRRKIE